MNVTIDPSLLRGRITPPPSKSESHRLILGAALCEGRSKLSNMAWSEDVDATLDCIRALHAGPSTKHDVLFVNGMLRHGRLPDFSELPLLNCGESGSTLRFLIPVALAVAGGGVFTGRGRLMERPQTPYCDLFREKGIAWEQTPQALTVHGRLTPGEYRLPGDVSSQFFTGLLYALSLLDGPSSLVSTTALESASYLELTLQAMRHFGAECTAVENGFTVPGNAKFRPAQIRVGADWSNAAFWLAACILGSRLELNDLDADSAQGDRVIADLVTRLEAPGNVSLDVSDCPDLVPPLAVIAALRSGEETHITGAARLRMKESDRLATVTQTLNTLGAQVDERADSLHICGVQTLHGGTVDGCNDHRIAMMAAIAATRADGPVTITGAQCIKKSYPDFWKDYRKLGGKTR